MFPPDHLPIDVNGLDHHMYGIAQARLRLELLNYDVNSIFELHERPAQVKDEPDDTTMHCSSCIDTWVSPRIILGVDVLIEAENCCGVTTNSLTPLRFDHALFRAWASRTLQLRVPSKPNYRSPANNEGVIGSRRATCYGFRLSLERGGTVGVS